MHATTATTQLVTTASVDESSLLPSAKEIKALRQFVSNDATRTSLSVLWVYSSEGGHTYVATDGHTMAVRRSGAHKGMSLHDIAKLPPMIERGLERGAPEDGRTPPAWPWVCRAGDQGELAPAYGMNPAYFARIGDVEKAAGQRVADDLNTRDMPLRAVKARKEELRRSACAKWVIPSDPLDGWYFRIETAAASWDGVLMPRRV